MRVAVAMVLLMMVAAAALAQNRFAFDRATETKIVGQDELRHRCGVHHAINGCTEFVERELLCRCVLDATRWRIAGRTRVRPRMYLADPYYATHERLHLKDLTIAVNGYLRGLGRAQFETRDACSAAAASAEAEFASRFDAFIRLSNLRLH